MRSTALGWSSFLEDRIAATEGAQNFFPDSELPSLVLISHAHSPPLNAPPQLRFDVRSLPNPPKHIRDAHTGTSKRLQEWMHTEAKFLARRDEINSKIEATMANMKAEYDGGDLLNPGPRQNDIATEDRIYFLGTDPQVETEEENVEEGRPDLESVDYDDSTSRDQSATLRVGIFCAMGKHRSVAMVEELGKLAWPGWRVEVQHRDIFKKHGAREKPGGQRSRGNRGGVMPTEIDGNSE